MKPAWRAPRSIVREAEEFIRSEQQGAPSPVRPKSRSYHERGHRAEGLLPLRGLVKIYFEDSKRHGLSWEGTRIVAAAGLAKKLGVRPGWRIHMIDGRAVQDGDEVWQLILDAQWQWRSCWVWFIKDAASIREDEARARDEAAEAARRPFAGVRDARHLAQLRAAFAFQRYIEDAENRAITLPQLQRVVEWAQESCFRWWDTAPLHISSTSGQVLQAGVLNLYHLNDWLIKPATEAKDCSFVELLASEKQPAAWFVSHWWGEHIGDFMRCVEAHAAARSVPEGAGFWVCAYANRQHSLQGDISMDPKQSSFYKAMQLAEFRVLLVLNEATPVCGPAVPFTRIWCAFEETMCLERPEATLDVATCRRGRPELLTQGLTPSEEAMEKQDPGSGAQAKSDREQSFPLEIVEVGLGVELQRAQASVESDRDHILNSIAERELRLPPLSEHENYDKANCRLRGRFALAFWRRAFADRASEQLQRLRAKLSEALRGDVWRTSLDLSLAGLRAVTEAELVMLTGSLPPNLEELKLDMAGLTVTDEGLGDIVAAMPRGLQGLSLELARCQGVGDAGVAALREHLPPKLAGLRLGLQATRVSREVREQCQSLKGLKSCKALDAPDAPGTPPAPAKAKGAGSKKKKKG